MTYSRVFLNQIAEIARILDDDAIERIVHELVNPRDRRGRLFFLGVGGSAANCSHAVNDFRKLAHIEAYSPIDNVAELTARTNDEGWETVFASWLETSQACENDAVFVLSVGGGDAKKKVSANIVAALDEAKRRRTRILGVIGRSEGYTKTVVDEVIVIPSPDQRFLTAHTEAFQAVVLH